MSTLTSREYSKQSGIYHNEILRHIHQLINESREDSKYFIQCFRGGSEEEPNELYIMTYTGVDILNKHIFMQPKSII